MVDAKELETYFEHARRLALDAGKLIVEGLNIKKDVEFKEDETDLVTKYDREVEEILVQGLKKSFPKHKFIAEESCWSKQVVPDLTDEPTWIIDPIDGTTNFVHGFPHICISLAFAVNKQVQIGIVYNPWYNELYTAKKGQGAFLNGKRIKTSKVTSLKKALVASEPFVAHRVPLNREVAKARAELLIAEAQGYRDCGSAALILAHVAQGIMDSAQCVAVKIWDLAAGLLLVEEAGGHITNFKGGPYDLTKPGVLVAANTELSADICKRMNEIDLQVESKFQKL